MKIFDWKNCSVAGSGNSFLFKICLYPSAYGTSPTLGEELGVGVVCPLNQGEWLKAERVLLYCCLVMGADLGSMLFDNDFLTLMAGKLTLKFGKLTYLCTRKNAK